MSRWFLPEGFDELLPGEAGQLETLRRTLLDLYWSWGYDVIVPPLVEHLDALQTGVGSALDKQTFKMTDPLSGKTLGIRADITPQAARIDAHSLNNEGPSRLCYIGSVLRSYGEGFGSTRNPVQLGAELYGHQGVEADLEILGLMITTLQAAGVPSFHLDIGHVGVFSAIAQAANLDANQEQQLFNVLQTKAPHALQETVAALGVSDEIATIIIALGKAHGGLGVLEEAGDMLAVFDPQVGEALLELKAVVDGIQRRYPTIPVHIDLTELHGYEYKTGLVFSALTPGVGQEIARGGRYDNIGEAFGRGRPATGFSADLKTLLAVAELTEQEAITIIAPPYTITDNDVILRTMITQLRADGYRVQQCLSNNIDAEAPTNGAVKYLVKEGDDWKIVD